MGKQMIDSEESRSLIRRMQKERKRKNLVIQVFIAVFVIGYAFFLTSSTWYPSNSDLIRATTFNKEMEWKDRTITLLSWDYSKDQQLMEVKIDLKNKSLDGVKNYEYQALDRKKGFFQVEPVLEKDDFIVLHIKGVDKRWSEISLRIMLPEEDENAEVMKLYTNVEEVNYVGSITEKSENEYYAERINDRIANYENLIAELVDEISEYNDEIEAANENIEKLEADKQFQTEQEQTETDQSILRIKNEIESIQGKIDEDLLMSQEYQDRIDNAKEEIKQYQD